jgi:serine/threonine protein kinase
MSDMSPGLMTVFTEALERTDPAERSAYLDRACGGDAELRRRVEELLAAHPGMGRFLEPDVTADGMTNATGSFAADPATKSYEPDGTVTHDLPADRPGRTPALGLNTVIAGRYTLTELIGEGGMGSVYLASQTEPVKRQIALKLIKTGMDSKGVLARFDAERQALALMDHPNIARIYDGGVTPSGQPFFVMELVKGIPLTEYCDSKRLTVDARLQLFVQVCQAVQHAHQKGIIHRDLKPGNVLVTEVDGRPTPKVIDFGVAKATEQKLTDQSFSDTGAIVGTPAYMSPEQADPSSMDIDTRTDVYALGVMLYELLTGSPPIDSKQFKRGAILEMLRMVREVEPPRPSTKLSTADALPNIAANRSIEPSKLSKLLQGELDWVVMKALEKDRDRRYATANGFAADIQRYLADEVVEARPPSRGYRLKKFVKRNKVQVLAASLVLLALLAGIAGTTIGLFEAKKQQEVAEVKEREANDERAKAVAAKEEEAQQRKLAEAEKKKAVAFRDKALDALRATTGTDVEKLLGEKKELTVNEKAYLEAIAQRWQTFAKQEGTDEQSRAISAEGHFRVALLWHKLGRRDEAQPEYEQTVARFEKLVTDFPAAPEYRSDLANCHNNMGTLMKDLGKRVEAEAQYRKGLAIDEKLAADYPAMPAYRNDLAMNHNNLGNLLADLGKLVEAEEQYRNCLAIQEKLTAEFPTVPDYQRDLAGSHSNLGKLLANLGKRVEAEEQYKKGLALQEKLAAEFPAVPEYRRDLANNHHNLGNLLADLGKRVEAEEQYRKGLAIQQKLAADFPAVPNYRSDLAQSHNNLGILLKGQGKGPDAEEQYRKGLAFDEKLAVDFPAMPAYRKALAKSHHNLGKLLADLGKRVEAEVQYRKGLTIQEKLAAEFPTVPAYRNDLATSHTNLGILFKDLGKRPEAEEHYRNSLAIDEKLAADFPAIPAYRNGLAKSHNNLGNLLADHGKRVEAEGQYRNCLAIQEKLAAEFPTVPDYRRDLAKSHHNLGNLLKDLGERVEAEEQYRNCLAIQEKLAAEFPAMPDYRGELAVSRNSLGILFTDLGKRPEAEEQYRKSLAIKEKLAAEFPAMPKYRKDLANSHNNLGILFTDLGKRPEAEEQYRKGLAIQEKLAADFPAMPSYRVDLGGSYCNFGNLVRYSSKPADSLEWFDKAIDMLRPVHEADPRDVTAKQFLRISHANRALAYHATGKHNEAVNDWDKAVELSPPQQQPAFRASRAKSQLQAGMVAEAVAEVAELTKLPNWNAGRWYDFACVYAVASGKIADKKAEYADRAMELLAKAVKAGYKDVANMKKDTDLDPLREREDFKTLMAELEKKYPPSKEAAPMPKEKK